MKIINLTPHDVKIVDKSGAVIRTYLRSDQVARVATCKEICGSLDGIDIKRVSYGDVEVDLFKDGEKINSVPMPDPTPDEYSLGGFHTIYIVSMVVAQSLSGRNDILCPDTAPDAVVRDSEGKIIGVKNFAQY